MILKSSQSDYHAMKWPAPVERGNPHEDDIKILLPSAYNTRVF